MTPQPIDPFAVNRRHFFKKTSTGIGGMALASLLANDSDNGVLGGPEVAPKAKRVIYLFQSGGPSQFELFDNKPYLREHHGEELPAHARGRETGMSSHQSSIPMAGSVCTEFSPHGKSGQEMSAFIPWHHKIADEIGRASCRERV